jgi:hypothetical protein
MSGSPPACTVADSLESLRGKSIAISDQASPAKNFFSIVLAKKGIDPVQDVEWRQYPGNLLALAVEKGEAQALADIDPLTTVAQGGQAQRDRDQFVREYADRTRCLLTRSPSGKNCRGSRTDDRIPGGARQPAIPTTPWCSRLRWQGICRSGRHAAEP